MNLSTTVKRRIDEYNPKGFLAHTAKLILALCGGEPFLITAAFLWITLKGNSHG